MNIAPDTHAHRTSGSSRTLRGRFTRPLIAMAAVAALGGLGALSPAGTAHAAPALPTPIFGSTIDAYAKADKPGCDPSGGAKPGTVAFKDIVLASYPDTTNAGLKQACGQGDLNGDDHEWGKAWDWGGLQAGNATKDAWANQVLNWLLKTDEHGNQNALARRFGIKEIIWNHKIWEAYSPGWHDYSGTSNPHTDHIHFGFSWDGAYKRTSYWNDGILAAPDVTGDGRPDVVARQANGDLLVYRHNGKVNGASTWHVPGDLVGHGWSSGMSTIRVGQAGGNSSADLVSVDADGDLWLYQNTGVASAPFGGRVQVGHGFGADAYPVLTLADADNDGWDELFTVNAAGDLLVFPHSGGVNGASTWQAPKVIGPGWGAMTAFAAEDVNRDGRADIVARNAAGELLLYVNSGVVNGKPGFFTPVEVGHGFGGMTSLNLRDVTGDGLADLLCVDQDGGLRLYTNRGVNGSSTFASLTAVGSGWGGMTAVTL